MCTLRRIIIEGVKINGAGAYIVRGMDFENRVGLKGGVWFKSKIYNQLNPCECMPQEGENFTS